MKRADVIKRCRELDKLAMPHVQALGKINAEKACLLKEWDVWQREQTPVTLLKSYEGQKKRVRRAKTMQEVALSAEDVIALAKRMGIKLQAA